MNNTLKDVINEEIDDTETSFNNIEINIDKLQNDEKENPIVKENISIDDYLKQNEEPKPKKVDRRKTSSRLNIAKAREAKARKRAEQQARLKQLFGDSDSESGDTETGSDTESEEDTYINKYHKHKYKQLYSQTRKELNEMKTLLFKMAEKNKRHRRKQRKSVRALTPDEAEKSPEERDTRRDVSQQPIVNVYTTQPETKQEGSNSLFRQMLRRRLTNR